MQGQSRRKVKIEEGPVSFGVQTDDNLVCWWYMNDLSSILVLMAKRPHRLPSVQPGFWHSIFGDSKSCGKRMSEYNNANVIGRNAPRPLNTPFPHTHPQQGLDQRREHSRTIPLSFHPIMLHPFPIAMCVSIPSPPDIASLGFPPNGR